MYLIFRFCSIVSNLLSQNGKAVYCSRVMFYLLVQTIQIVHFFIICTLKHVVNVFN